MRVALGWFGGKMSERRQLDIEDYLEATGEASARSRNMVLFVAVASILAFAGLLNSLQSQWMLGRVQKLNDEKGDYAVSKLGQYPAETGYKRLEDYKKAIANYEYRYQQLCSAIERAYVENAMTIRVPVLGFAFDVNDLGLLSGLGFAIILSCYRFFLSREVDNLRVSFAEAEDGGTHILDEYYRLLAMRQVFTVPMGEHVKRSFFLRVVPKAIAWLPLTVLLAVIGNDLHTLWIARELGWGHFVVNFAFTLLCIVVLIPLCISISVRLVRMDRIWLMCWQYLEVEKREAGSGSAIWDLSGDPDRRVPGATGMSAASHA
jgi:hypothetical protein